MSHALRLRFLLKVLDAEVMSFVPRPILVSLSSEVTEGYVGELVPVKFKMENKDDRKVFLRLSIFLQPDDEEDGKLESPS